MSFSTLTWGVKESFRAYVEAREGTITVSDGATRTDEGTFVFNAAPDGDLSIAPDGSATGAMQFQGTVSFEAHGGMLKATITELALEIGGEGLVLTALDTQMDQRCELATISIEEVDASGPVTLGTQITMDGMYMIADNYPPGTELDPIRLA